MSYYGAKQGFKRGYKRGRKYARPFFKAASYASYPMTALTGSKRNYVMAKRALDLAKQVKGLVNTEFKSINYPSGSDTPATTGTVDCLTLVAQGDTAITRNGNSIKAKSLSFKARLSIHGTASSTVVRIMLILDKEFDQALPTLANILDSTDVKAHMNLDYAKRFKVLRNKIFIIERGAGDSGPQQLYYEDYIPLDLKIRYDAGTAAAADAKENQLLLVMLSSEPTNTPTVSWSSRVRFIDN